MKTKWIIFIGASFLVTCVIVVLWINQTINFSNEQHVLARKFQEITSLDESNHSYKMVFTAEPIVLRDSGMYSCLGIASQKKIENTIFTLRWSYSDGTKIVKEIANTEYDVIMRPAGLYKNKYPDVFADQNLNYSILFIKCVAEDIDKALVLEKVELSGSFQINGVWYGLANEIIYQKPNDQLANNEPLQL
jgi:hypothetical protein